MTPGPLTSATSVPPPRFLPLAIRFLGPTLLLALLAGGALVRDWRGARTDAASRAGDLAALAGERLATLLEAREAPSGGSSGAAIRAGVDWFRVGPSNVLLEPAMLPWPPQPEPLAGPTSVVARTAWLAARNALDAGDPETAIRGYEQALDSGGLDGAPEATMAAGASGDAALGRWRANVRYEHALALERAGRIPDAIEAFQALLESPGASAIAVTTEAGLPVSHLAALRITELAGAQATSLPSAWRRDPGRIVALLSDWASPYSAECIERLGPRLRDWLAAGDSGLTPERLESIWRRAERSRLRHAAAIRRHGTAEAWPAAFWIDDTSPGWLAVGQSPAAPAAGQDRGGRVFALFPEIQVREALRSAALGIDRRAEFVLRVTVGGRNLAVTARAASQAREALREPERDELVTVSRRVAEQAPVVVGVALADAPAYYAGQRRRGLVFGGLLVAALAVATASTVATHRAWQRQHALNLQKSNFVSSVSHELRSPLGSIRLLAEGLERGTVADPERQREYFRLIGQETRRLGGLVDNVLDFSRIEQGRKRYEFEPVDLTALVRGTLQLFEPLAAEQHVVLAAEVPSGPPPPEFIADGRALQQALLNLLDNALKHSPAGARIRVGLAWEPALEKAPTVARPRRVRLSVADAGPGIPAEEQERIFEPFYRRGSELRRDTRGVGIGLSIVRHIIEAHGGTVVVRSQPAAGAEFTMELPCAS